MVQASGTKMIDVECGIHDKPCFGSTQVHPEFIAENVSYDYVKTPCAGKFWFLSFLLANLIAHFFDL